MTEPAATDDLELAERWQRHWRSCPDLAAFVRAHDVDAASTLVAIVRVDQRERWQRGERLLAEIYLRQFPHIADDTEAAIDLVYGEFLMRQEFGDDPSVEEYARRFPRWAELLHRQALVDAAFSGDFMDMSTSAAAALPGLDMPSTAVVPARAVDTVNHAWPQFPGYQLIREIGRGGMGVVYQARQISLNRIVALKTLAHAAGDANAFDRFRREAHAVARLQHPHIVQVFEVGAVQGAPFLALELVDGPNLAQFCAGAPQAPRAAAQLVEILARTIQFAHQHGIIHRDLKPANVLLRHHDPNHTAFDNLEATRPKLTDFGLAKEVEAPAALTVSGAILGTPSYMAPEQARGDSQIGPAADIYALGAILYELLVGRPPFRGASVLETLQQVLAQDPVAVARLQPATPRDLETICHKCLAKEPGRRYASAEALADDLHSYLMDQPIRARAIGQVERGWRWCRRNPFVATMTATVALLLVAVTIGSIATAFTLQHRRNAALAAEETARAERNRASTEEQRARTQLGAAYFAQAQAQRSSGQAGRRYESLRLLEQSLAIARAAPLTPEQTLAFRNEAVASLALADVAIARWHDVPTGCSNFAFQRGFDRYLTTDQAGSLMLIDFNTGQLIDSRRLRPEPPDLLRWCPNDRFVALRYRGDVLVVYDWLNKQICLQTEGKGLIRAVAFSPDGAHLAFGLQSGGLHIAELKSPFATRALGACVDPESLAFSPDGANLAVASLSGAKVDIVDVSTGKQRATLPHISAVFDVAWHPDGNLLAGAIESGPIQLWDIATGQSRGTLTGHEAAVTGIGFSHDGNLLASVSWDGTGRLWHVDSQRQLLSVAVNCTRPQFSSDDRQLAAAFDGRRLGLFDVAPGRELQSLHGTRPLATLAKVDAHPDGRWLSVASRDGVSFWDWQTGRHVQRWHLPGTRYGLFAPDGKHFFTTGIYGVQRWAFAADPESPGRYQLGPAQVVFDGRGVDTQRAAISRNGRTLVVQRSGKNPLRIDLPLSLRPWRDLADAYENAVAVSPDGELTATGSWTEPGVRIVRSKNGALVSQLDTAPRANVLFRPDGRILATGTPTEYALWDAASGAKLRAFAKLGGDTPGEMAFSPDGRTLAVQRSRTQAQLVDAETAEILAVLEAPVRHEILSLTFHPDGTRLAVHYGVDLTHIWDLRQLRAGLATLDLDWAGPPYAKPPANTPNAPLAMRIDSRMTSLPKNPITPAIPGLKLPIKPK